MGKIFDNFREGGRMTHSIIRFGLTIAAAVALHAAAPAQESPDPVARIKALNQKTGSEAQQAALLELVKDEKEGRALAGAGAKLAKENPSQMTYGTTYMLGVVARNLKDYADARVLLKLACIKALDVQSVNKAFESYENLIDVLMLDKKSGEAVKECEELIQMGLGKTNEEFRNLEIIMDERLVQALAADGKMEKALSRATDLLDSYPIPRFMRLKGDILREADRLDEAEKFYIQALRELEKGKSDLDDEESGTKKGEIRLTRYVLSSIYVDMNKIDKAAEQLQTLLKDAPDNSTFNNDLGFVWADHDMHLDESETMIRKAIAIQNKQNEILKSKGIDTSDPAAYLDSLGWVLFKKKKYAEAKKEMLVAVQTKEGQHVEILDHLGDIHMALGEKKEAVETWEKALKMESDSKRDKKRKVDVEAKLKKAKGE